MKRRWLIGTNILVLVLLVCTVNSLNAQNATFKKSKVEFRTGVGASLFFGDLGGNFEKRKGGFLDLEPKTIRYNINGEIKYNFTRWLAVRSDFNIAKLVADDGFSNEPFRHNRNLSFRTNIAELSFSGELVVVNLFKFLKLNKLHTELYFFGGAGIFSFQPQAKYNGLWYNLRPLGTEGQELIPGTKKYGVVSGVIPMGGGLRKLVSSSLTIGLELSLRKSFTDYIDDVSGRYYSKDIIREHRGEVAAALSDRSLTPGNRQGSLRGNPNRNDNYSFIQLYMYKGISSQLIRSEQDAYRKIINNKTKCPKFR